MITLHKEEPGWLGRPVARAAGDGRPARVGLGTLRFGLGCGTTEAEIRYVGAASDPSRRDCAGCSGSDRLRRRVGAVLIDCSCRAGQVVPGLATFRSVCTQKDFQLADCASQLIVGGTPHLPVGAASLQPSGGGPRSQVKRLEKGARFRVSSRDNSHAETTELADIHGTSRSGTDRVRSDCTPGAAPTRPQGPPGGVRSTTRSPGGQR
jgi:hypothetical protein